MRYTLAFYTGTDEVDNAEWAARSGKVPGVTAKVGSFMGRGTVRFWSDGAATLRQFLGEYELVSDPRYCEIEIEE